MNSTRAVAVMIQAVSAAFIVRHSTVADFYLLRDGV